MSGLVSVINRAGSVVQGVGSAVRGATALSNDLTSLLGGASPIGYGAGAGVGAWAAGMQPASWRGVPFAVRTSDLQRGRRIALHEYPYRDDPWPEDIGLAKRIVSFSGFLVGDDVFSQRDAMVAAAETAGTGALVHPSLGSITATLLSFSAGERAEAGRVVELQFVFLQGAEDTPLYPSLVASTQTLVGSAADEALSAVGSDFGADVATALTTAADVVRAGVTTVSSFAGTVTKIAADASCVAGAVRGLGAIVGGGAYFGRYDAGGLAMPNTALGVISQTLSLGARTELAVTGLLSAAVTATTAVKTAAASATTLAAAL